MQEENQNKADIPEESKEVVDVSKITKKKRGKKEEMVQEYVLGRNIYFDGKLYKKGTKIEKGNREFQVLFRYCD